MSPILGKAKAMATEVIPDKNQLFLRKVIGIGSMFHFKELFPLNTINLLAPDNHFLHLDIFNLFG